MAEDGERHEAEPTRERRSTRCVRCRGLMVSSVTALNCAATDFELGWRCLSCGEFTDACIEANRINPPPLVQSRARVPGSPVARTRKPRR